MIYHMIVPSLAVRRRLRLKFRTAGAGPNNMSNNIQLRPGNRKLNTERTNADRIVNTDRTCRSRHDLAQHYN